MGGDMKPWRSGAGSFLLLFFFLILLVIGINTGEVASVWEKAVTICLSCMGIN